MKELEFFKLENRVLFEAAAAAEIVDAAEMAQNPDNANVSESAKQEQKDRDTLKNAPPENPAANASDDVQADPAEIADIDAVIEQLIEGEIPTVEADGIDIDADVDSDIIEAGTDDFIEGEIIDNGLTISTDKELVVINSTVADKDTIIAELKPDQEVLILEDGNGLDELNEYLDNSDTKYSAIHFVTHGNDGYISVNGELIDSENFDAAQWKEIGEHLTEDGDILLYGCDTAANAEGKLLTEMISEASGADVAASVDATGISGDWDLEYTVGEIDVDEITVENFEHNLTNYSVTNLNDSGTGSLRQAITDANANAGTDEITFSVDGTIKFNSEITISSDISIIGNGTDKTILDGQNQKRLFTIKSGEIKISHLTMQNGYTQAYTGGAILNSGALSVEDVTFLDNKAGDGGGAIYNNSVGTLLVDDCDFSGNAAFYSYGCTGGAISNSGSLTVLDSSFDNNTAYGSGGAIYSSKNIIISNSTFSKNSSRNSNGGAVYCEKQLTVSNSVFSENSAAASGGALESDDITAFNNTFTDNSAGVYGGAIAVNGGVIGNSTFYGNDSKSGGAGVYFYYSSPLTVFNSVFTENRNSPDGDPGAIYEHTSTGQLNLYNNIFVGNDGSDVSVQRNVDLNNLYTSDVSAQETFADIDTNGNAVLTDNELLIKTDGPADGTGLYVWYSGDLKNIAYSTTENGPKTAVLGDASKTTGLASALNNSGKPNIGSGETELADAPSLIVTTASDVVNNKDGVTSLREAIAYAESKEGADEITFAVDGTFYLDSAITISSELTITGKGKDVTIFDGKGKDRLFVINSGAIVKISNATLQNGFAGSTSNGGAIYNKGTLTVSDAYFSGNKTEYQAGGAIYNSSTGALSVFNTTFSGNQVGSSGGAIYNYGGAVLIENSTFAGNKASGFGGAIYNVNDTIKIFNSTFSGNTATQGGDALYFNEYGGSVLINNIIIGNDIEGNISRDINNLYSDASVAETFEQVSYGKAVLNDDGTFHIKAGGKAHGKGVFVWHDEDYSAIAYSQTIDGEKTAVVGDVALATTLIATDQLGQTRTAPTSIGAYHLAAAEKSSLVVTTTSDVVDAYDNVTSLREAIAYAESKAGADEITFAVDGTIKFNSEITISTDITFTGKGTDKTIFDGQAKTRFFTVNSDTEVELSNITFQNGYSGDHGGAIYNDGTLTISNSTLTGNNASEDGGAIYNSDSGTLTISDSTFTGNTVTNSYTVYGGAIYNDGTLTVNDSTFTENSTDAGGAIGNNGTSAVINCTFTGNSAGNGGAIYNDDDGTLTVTNCTFTGHKASLYAGAIRNDGTLTVDNSIFTGNTANNYGGAIYNTWGTLTVTNSTFTGNSARNGGAIRNGETLTVTNCTFTENSAVGGGAIANYDDLTVTNSTFTGNNATNYGDAIYNESSTLNLVNNIFVGNGSSKSQEIYGTIAVDINNIYTSADVTVANTFAELDADGNAILNADGTVHIKTGGSAHGTGVFVWHNEDYSALAYSETINGEKTAVIGSVDAATILISTDQLGKTRTAPTLIGAYHLAAAEKSSLVVTTTSDVVDAYDNLTSLREAITYAESKAGADEITFAVDGTFYLDSAITISTDITITGNGSDKTVFDGQNKTYLLAIAEKTNVTVNGITLQNGYSSEYGGAILNSSNLSVLNTVFKNNVADVWGGAIANDGTVSIVNSSFSGNIANRGGAIYNAGSIIIEQSLFEQNQSTYHGGAIYNSSKTGYGDAPFLTVINSTFYKNHGGYGGAISNYDGVLNVISTTIVDNSAYYSSTAGGIDSEADGALYLINSIVAGNTAGGEPSNLWAYVPKDAQPLNNVFDSVEDIVETDANGNIVLSSDGTVHIKAGGPAHGKGIFVWHNEDYSAIAYSQTIDGEKTAVVGNVALATTLIATDQLGQTRTSPTDIGAVIAEQQFIEIDPAASNFNCTITAQEYDGTNEVDNASIKVTIGGVEVELSWTSALFDSANVDDVTTATFSGLYSLTSGYILSTDTITVNAAGKIFAREITVKADAVNQVYGDAEKSLTYNVAGLVGDDTLEGSLTRESGKNAGDYEISLGTLANSNYIISFTGNTYTVTKRDLTISANNIVNHTYGTSFTLDYSNSSLGTGDSFTGNLEIDPADTNKSSSGHYAVGNHAITMGTLDIVDGSGADMSDNYNISFNNGILTVTPAEIQISTVTVADKVYDGTTQAVLNSWSFNSDLANNDDLALSGNAVFGNKHAGTGKSASVSELMLSGSDAGNYILTTTSLQTTASIAKAAIAIQANDAGKVYNAADPELGHTVLSGTLFGDDQITISREAGENIGSYAIDQYLISDGNNGNNYDVDFIAGTFSIASKSAVITVGNITLDYNGMLQDATEYTVAGLEDGHFIYSIDLEGARNAGTHSVSVESVMIHDAAGNDVTGNYDLVYESGTLLINQAQITVNAVAKSITYGETAEGTYTYTGTLFGNDVFTGALSINGSMNSRNTLLAAGTARFDIGTLEISDSNDGNNYQITFNGADLTIKAKEISLSAVEIQNKVYDGTTNATVLNAEVSGSIAGDDISADITGAQAAFAGKNAGNDVAVNASGFTLAGADNGNYILKSDEFTTSADISKANLTVSVQDSVKTYGDADPRFTAITEGLKTGDSITGIGRSDNGANVGSYDIDLYTLNDGNNGGNYEVTFNKGTLTVNAKPITVTADAVSKVYGSADPRLTYRADGLVGNDTLSGSLERAAGENVGSYAISQGTLGNSNYIINFTGADYTITKRDLTISANNIVNHTYGTSFTLDYSNSSLGAGDSFIGSLEIDPADTNKSSSGHYAVGNHAITMGTLDIVDGSGADMSDNYNISFNSGILTVTPAEIQISTVTVADKVYDGTTQAVLNSWSFNSDLANNDDLALSGNAVFGDKHAGTGKSASVSELMLSGSDAGNYILTTTSLQTTASIAKAAIAIQANDAGKVYNAADPKLGHTVLSGTLFGDDQITVSREAGENIGSYAIDQYLISDGNNGNNYDVDFIAGTFSIASKSAVITVGNTTLDYNGMLQDATEYTVAGLEDGHYIYSIDLEGARNAGTHSVSVESVMIHDAAGNDVTGNYDLVYESGTLLINQAQITVNAVAKSITYGETAEGTYTYTGTLFGNDVFTGALSINGSLNSRNTLLAAGTARFDIGTLEISDSNDGNNYQITFNGADLTVKAKEISLSAVEIQNKVYDGTTNATVLNAEVSGSIAGDDISADITGAQASFASKNVGDDVAVNASGFTLAGADKGNYILKSDEFTSAADISKANLTVSVQDSVKTYGDADPRFTAITEGLKTGDSITGIGRSDNGANVGSYDIDLYTLNDGNNGGNYEVTFNKGTLTINAKEITVKADAVSKVYGSADPRLTYRADGLVGNDTLSGSLERAAGENVGSYAISQGTLGNSNYIISFTNAALTITAKELNVDPGNSELVWNISEQLYDGDNTVDNAAIYINGMAVVWNSALFNSADVADVESATFNGLSISDSNYVLSADSITLDAAGKILARELAVKANDAEKISGEADPAFTWQLTGGELVGGDEITGSLSREAGEDAGLNRYAITQGTLTAGSNYNIVFTSGFLSVKENSSLVVSTTADVVDIYDGVTSLREAVTYANELAYGQTGASFTVTFAVDDVVLDNEIVIGSNLSGNHLQIGEYGCGCNISVKPGSNNRIFRFGDENDTTSVWDIDLRYLSLSGGDVTGKGGLVFIQGAEVTLNIENSDFKDASATGDGGAIYSFSSGEQYIEINNSRFIGNSALGGNGGALAIIAGGDLTVNLAADSYSYVIFEENSAGNNINTDTGNGGAVYIKGPDNGKGSSTVTIGNEYYSGTHFQNNHADVQGGAVYIQDLNQNTSSPSRLQITNCYFQSNTSGYYGGAVSLYGSGLWDVDISDGYFYANGCEPNGYTGGGAISLQAIVNDWNITGSTFANNYSKSNGGAIEITGYTLSQTPNPTITIANSSFTNNEAENNGGAIHCYGDLTIENSDFTNNSASNYGGAIWNGEDITISGSSFANNSTSYNGGAIYNNGDLTVENSDFTNNSAQEGGAIYNDWNRNVTTSGSLFTNNSAQEGGAIYNDYNSNLTISGSSFSNNSANSSGGAIWNYGDLTVENSDFTDNSAMGYFGGAIATRHSNVTISGSSFTNNSAADEGGAIYNDWNCNVSINGSLFTNNSASSYGGAIYSGSNSNVTVNGSSFSNNSASLGGAIYNLYSDDSPGFVSIDSSTFIGNQARYSGGAVYDVQVISNSTFINNKAEYTDSVGDTYHGEGDAVGVSNINCSIVNSTFYSDDINSDSIIDINNSFEINLVNSIVIGSCSSGNGKINAWYSVIDKNFVNGEYKGCKDADDLKEIFEWDQDNDKPLFVTSEVDGVEQTAIKILEKSFVHGSGRFVWHDDSWSNIAVSRQGDGSDKVAIIGDAALAVTLIVKDQLAQDIDTTIPATSIGAYYLQPFEEDKSLTVTVNDDVVDAYDYKTSLREALIYANELAFGKTGESITVTFAVDDVVLNDEIMIGSNLSGNRLQIGKYDSAEINISVKPGSDSRIFRFGDENDTTSVWDICLRGLSLSGGNATGKGGLVFIQGAEVTLDIYYSYFKDASATEDGGAIYSFSSGKQYVEISRTFFENNSALDGNGGALAIIAGGDLTVNLAHYSNDYVWFVDNSAGRTGWDNGNGGAVYIKGPDYGKGSSTVTIGNEYYSGTHFQNNHADYKGGAVYITDFNQDISAPSSLVIEGCDFSSNTAGYEGGALSVVASGLWDIEISYSEFKSNKVDFVQQENISIDEYAYGAGAISLYGHAENWSILNSEFSNNSTNLTGGAIRMEAMALTNTCTPTVTVSGCTFTDNTADYDGGALYYTAYSGISMRISGSSFSGNTSNGNGGAIAISDYYLGNRNVLIENTTFTNNKAVDGGAIAMSYTGKWNSYELSDSLTLVNCSFVNNTATANGGAISATGSIGALTDVCITAVNSTFYGNTAANGGAIAMISSNATAELDLYLVNSTIIQNQGGGISLSSSNADSSVDLLNTIVFDNSANSDISVSNNQLNALYSLIGSANTAISGSGNRTAASISDIFATDSEGKVITSSYTPVLKSNSTAQGGGVYVWHDDNWSNIAWSAKSDGSGKSAFKGTSGEAAELLTRDKNNSTINTALPATSIGAYYLTQQLLTVAIDAPGFNYTITAQEYNGTANIADAEITITVNGETVKLSWNSALFDSSNVADVTSAVFSGLVSLNNAYALDTTTITLDAAGKIVAREITVKADNVTQVYGDAEKALTYEVSGLLGGDTLSGSLTRESGKNADDYEISLGTLANSNYIINYTGNTYTITKRDLTITANNIVDHTYGTSFTLDYSNSSLGAGDSFTGNLEIDPADTNKSSSGHYAVGNHAITMGTLDIVDGSGADMSDNYNISFNSGILNITPAEIQLSQVTAADKVYDGTTNATVLNAEVSGSIAGDDISADITGAQASFASKNVGDDVAVNASGFTLAGADNGNYILKSDEFTASADISKANLTVSVQDSVKTYGDADPRFTAITEGLKTGDTVTGLGRSDNGSDIGNYDIDLYTLNDGNNGGNYEVTFHKGTLTVNAKPITVTADAISKVYGSADPRLTYRADGLVGNDTLNGSLERAAGENVGSYAISQGTLENSNYIISFTGAALRITAKELKVDLSNSDLVWTVSEQVYDGDNTVDNATLYINGMEVNWESAFFNSADVADITTVTFNGLSIADSNYVLSSDSVTLDAAGKVVAKEITVKADAVNQVYGDAEKALTYDVSGLVGNDTLEGSLTRESGKNAGDYEISLGTLGNSNYIINFTGADYTITKRDLTISANNIVNHTYGTSFTLDYSNSSLGAGDSFTGSLEIDPADTNKSSSGHYAVGSHAITMGTLDIVDGSGADMSDNYNISFNNGILTVTPAEIQLSQVTVADKVYDGTSNATVLNAEVSGSIAGDDLALDITGAQASFASKNAGNDVAVNASGFTLAGADKGNYILKSDEFTSAADISKANLTICAQNAGKYYGEADPELTYNTDGLIAGDTLSGTLIREPGERAGSYKINQGTLDNRNYNIDFTAGTFTITVDPEAVQPGQNYSDGTESNFSSTIPAMQTALDGKHPHRDGSMYSMEYRDLAALEAAPVNGSAEKLPESGRSVDRITISEMTIDNISAGDADLGFSFKTPVKLHRSLWESFDLADELDVYAGDFAEKCQSLKSDFEKLLDKVMETI